MSRVQSAERSFTQRTSGVMKKANEVKNRFPDVKISVFISDGVETLVYQSDENWPPEMGQTITDIKAGEGSNKRKQSIYGPTDFITVSDAIRAKSLATTLGHGPNYHLGKQDAQEFSGLDQDSVSHSTLDSASLAVLEHIVPSILPPVAGLISTGYNTPSAPSPPPPKRARIVTRSKTAKKWDKYGFVGGKTGGEASQE